MNNKLSERFIECMDLLKSTELIPSLRQFSLAIGVHPQCISDIYTHKREVNADIILKAANIYDINPNYIFLGIGEPILMNSDNPNHFETTQQIGDQGCLSYKIKHVPYEIQDAYPSYLKEEAFLEKLPIFYFPDVKFSRGEHRSFDVSGDQMEPTIFGGEKLIGSLVERKDWTTHLKRNYVYVIVQKNQVVPKRIIDFNSNNGTITLKCDNGYYQDEIINQNEILEIWLVTNKISPFMPSPKNIRNSLFQEVDSLKSTISEQSKMIKSLNMTVEKLLKQNRQISLR